MCLRFYWIWILFCTSLDIIFVHCTGKQDTIVVSSGRKRKSSMEREREGVFMLGWRSMRGPATWGPPVRQRHLRRTSLGGEQGQGTKGLLSPSRGLDFLLGWCEPVVIWAGDGVTVAVLCKRIIGSLDGSLDEWVWDILETQPDR